MNENIQLTTMADNFYMGVASMFGALEQLSNQVNERAMSEAEKYLDQLGGTEYLYYKLKEMWRQAWDIREEIYKYVQVFGDQKFRYTGDEAEEITFYGPYTFALIEADHDD